MPRKNRREVFNPRSSACCHCTARCVRQLFLLREGGDVYRRKVMMQRRLMFLSQHFAIEVFSFALLDNHVHLLLRNQPAKVDDMTDREVATHWLWMFPGNTKKRDRKSKKQAAEQESSTGSTPLNAADEPLDMCEPSSEAIDALVAQPSKIAKLRIRLSDVSWLMRAFCQHVATVCNREDNVTGRFWQGRFHLQNMLDEASILACAIYIDLNPIRACKASSIEESHFTSALLRVRALKAEHDQIDSGESESAHSSQEEKVAGKPQKLQSLPPDWFLAPIELSTISTQEANCGVIRLPIQHQGFLHLKVEEYLILLEYIGAQKHPEKRGRISANALSIFERLQIDPARLSIAIDPSRKVFKRGTEVALTQLVTTATAACA